MKIESNQLEKAYKKIRREFPNMPKYSVQIGELFTRLRNDISNLAYSPEIPGSTFEQLARDNYKIQADLSKFDVKEITLVGNEKAFKVKVTNEILIAQIVKYILSDLTTYPIKATSKPKGALALLINNSYQTIKGLRNLGITNEVLTLFISNSVAYSKGGTWYNPNPFDDIDKKYSVVPIESVEAFQRAFHRGSNEE